MTSKSIVRLIAAMLLLAPSPVGLANIHGGPRVPLIGSSTGFWSLRSFGVVAPLVLHGDRSSASIDYRLHPQARQGPNLWFVVRVRARVDLGLGDGEMVLSASTNAHTAAQILIESQSGQIITKSLGLVAGQKTERTSKRFVNIIFDNYAQVNGIKPGAGTLTFTLDAPRLASAKVTIRSTSGIEVTRIKPDELHLSTEFRQLVANPADTVSIPFRLSRRGGRPDGAVRVVLSGAGDQSGEIAFPRVGQARIGAFNVTAPEETGDYLLALSVPDRYNQPSSSVRVSVVPVVSDQTNWRFISAMAVFAGLSGTAVWIFLRRRHDT